MNESIWTKLKTVERPQEERIYNKGDTQGIIKHGLMSFTIILIYLYIAQYLLFDFLKSEYIYSSINGLPMYDLTGNFFVFFIYFFMYLLPWGFGGFVHMKKKTPIYSFSILIGAIIAGGAFYLISDSINNLEGKFIGMYQVICALIILGSNLISQKDWTLKTSHMIYYLVFGMVVGFANLRILVFYPDVWVFLQMIFFHMCTVIAISIKIPQWSYSFMVGWILINIISMVFGGHDYLLMGIYSLSAPTLLSIFLLYYFYKIYKPNRETMFVNNPLKNTMVREE